MASERPACEGGSFRAGLKEVDWPTDAGRSEDLPCDSETGRREPPRRTRRRKEQTRGAFLRPIDETRHLTAKSYQPIGMCQGKNSPRLAVCQAFAWIARLGRTVAREADYYRAGGVTVRRG